MHGTIYIVSSGDILSGGVSSMHNLCIGLINSGFKAEMFYVYSNEELIREKLITRFKVPRSNEIVDDQKNVLIAPEILPQIFNNYNNVQKIIYWLSLQFFFKNKFNYPWPLNIKLIRKPFYSKDFCNKKPALIESFKQRILFRGIRKSPVWSNEIKHITNSYYTSSFCKAMGAKSVHILHNPLIDEVFVIKNEVRRNNILIGAKTSKLLVLYLKRYCRGYKIILLKGLSIDKVYKLMAESLVFAEFGISNRDRTPREAAILGCIVFTSNGGSAHYFEDVPIPAFYKIKGRLLNFRKIGKRILFAAENYSKHLSDFEAYRQQILEEKKTFSSRVKEIMDKILF